MNATQQIQSWYEPALRLYEQLLARAKQTLIDGGYPERNAAVRKEDWREEMTKQHRLHPSDVQEIERSLYRSGRIAYTGQNYITRIGSDV